MRLPLNSLIEAAKVMGVQGVRHRPPPSLLTDCRNEAVESSFRTLRKHTKTGETDLLNFDWNQSAIPAGISGFTECFDNVCDVTRFSH